MINLIAVFDIITAFIILFFCFSKQRIVNASALYKLGFILVATGCLCDGIYHLFFHELNPFWYVIDLGIIISTFYGLYLHYTNTVLPNKGGIDE